MSLSTVNKMNPAYSNCQYKPINKIWYGGDNVNEKENKCPG